MGYLGISYLTRTINFLGDRVIKKRSMHKDSRRRIESDMVRI